MSSSREASPPARSTLRQTAAAVKLFVQIFDFSGRLTNCRRLALSASALTALPPLIGGFRGTADRLCRSGDLRRRCRLSHRAERRILSAAAEPADLSIPVLLLPVGGVGRGREDHRAKTRRQHCCDLTSQSDPLGRVEFRIIPTLSVKASRSSNQASRE